MAGLDSPITNSSDDFFNREKIVHQISSLSKNTPENWSVRIGLYGGWGEGKSSVLELLENYISLDEFVLVKFSPSNISTSAEMWLDFYSSLEGALKKYGLDKTSWFKEQLEKEKKAIEKYGDTAGALFSGLSLIGGVPHAGTIFKTSAKGIKLLADKLSSDVNGDEKLKGLQNNLKNRKFLVIIDDLDRTNPELIPELLLNLRDVLDLPNFIFILAFDYSVITSAIEEKNPAWGDGSKFLEKIIDYPIVLPKIQGSDARKYLEHCFGENEIAKNIDLNLILNSVEHNPRKLKLLARQFKTVRPAIKRFNQDDINYDVFVIWMILKIEFPVFTSHFFSQINWDSLINQFGLRHMDSEVSAKKSDAAIKDIDEIISSLSLSRDKDAIYELLDKLIKYKSDSSSYMFEQSIEALESNVVITFKELNGIIEKINSEKNIEEQLRGELEALSDKDGFRTTVLVYEVCNKLIENYDKYLNQMAYTYALRDHNLFYEKANSALNYIEAAINIHLSAPNIERLKTTKLLFLFIDVVGGVAKV